MAGKVAKRALDDLGVRRPARRFGSYSSRIKSKAFLFAFSGSWRLFYLRGDKKLNKIYDVILRRSRRIQNSVCSGFRTQFTFCRVLAGFLAALGMTIMLGSVCLAADNQTTIDNALTYLRSQQQPDGSWVGFDGGINATIGSTIAVASTGQDPETWTSGGNSPFDYLESQAALLSDEASIGANTAKISQLILALVASGKDPHSFAGVDWAATLNKAYDPTTSRYGTFFIHQPWAILALDAAGDPIPTEAIGFLKDSQETDGGFAFNGKGTGSDTNATALCTEALITAGEAPSSDTITKVLAYLHTQQNDDGGFPWSNPSAWGPPDSDTCSTAWVVQSLIAAGEDPAGGTWTKAGNDPFNFLTGMQNASGALGFMKSWSADDLMSTYQTIPALEGKAFPIIHEEAPPPPPAPDPPPPPAPTPTAQPVAAPTNDGHSERSEESSSDSALDSSASPQNDVTAGASVQTPIQTALNNVTDQEDDYDDDTGSDNGQENNTKVAKKEDTPRDYEPSPLVKFIYMFGGFVVGSLALLGTVIGVRYGWNRWKKED